MEAKDTIINDCKYAGKEYMGDRFLELLKAQAEITASIFFEEGRKAGIREVVEWLMDNAFVQNLYINNAWQAKVKEWGL